MNIEIKLWSQFSPAELKDIHSIWWSCFGEDTWEEFESYQRWRLRRGYFYGLYDDHKNLVSMASLSPEFIKIGNNWMKAGFIVGVGTKPEERSKGYSHHLLSYLAEDAQGKNFAFLQLSTYIPKFYERLNYVAYGLHYRKRYIPCQGDVESHPLSERDINQMIFLWEKYAGCGTLKRDHYIMQGKFREACQSVGLYKNGKLLGYALQNFLGNTWDEVVCPQELKDCLPSLGEESYLIEATNINSLSPNDKFYPFSTYQMILAFEDLPIKAFCCRDDY